MQESGIWRVQRPRWLALERAYVKHVWRASQQAYRWWATLDCTAITLDKISDPYKVSHIRAKARNTTLLRVTFQGKRLTMAT